MRQNLVENINEEVPSSGIDRENRVSGASINRDIMEHILDITVESDEVSNRVPC